MLLTRQTAITLAKPSVLIHDAINLDMLQEIGLEPCLDQVDVLGVSVGQDECVLGVAVDEENLKLAATLAVEEEVVWVHWEARYWRLE